MNRLLKAGIYTATALASSMSIAQDGRMMNGNYWSHGFMSGYGGFWFPILIVGALVGLVVWVVKQKKK